MRSPLYFISLSQLRSVVLEETHLVGKKRSDTAIVFTDGAAVPASAGPSALNRLKTLSFNILLWLAASWRCRRHDLSRLRVSCAMKGGVEDAVQRDPRPE